MRVYQTAVRAAQHLGHFHCSCCFGGPYDSAVVSPMCRFLGDSPVSKRSHSKHACFLLSDHPRAADYARQWYGEREPFGMAVPRDGASVRSALGDSPASLTAERMVWAHRQLFHSHGAHLCTPTASARACFVHGPPAACLGYLSTPDDMFAHTSWAECRVTRMPGFGSAASRALLLAGV
jgi:hypothetical protein